MDRFLYYGGCFAAIIILQSLPHFLFEAHQPVFLFDRVLVLALFLLLAWFFRKSLHGTWHWSILSSMFFIESLAAVCLAVLLFFQLFSLWFAFITGMLIIAKIAVYSYLAIDRLPQLRGLVYTSCFALLLIAELILTFGVQIV